MKLNPNIPIIKQQAQSPLKPAGDLPLCKTALLAELMGQPAIYDKIGSAWRLFMRLIFAKDGLLAGTKDDIAKLLGDVNKDTARNWIKHLKEEGIVEVEQDGWQVTMKLLGEYMKIAQAPEVIREEYQVLPPESHEIISFRKIAEGTHGLGGTMTITINVGHLSNSYGKQTTQEY